MSVFNSMKLFVCKVAAFILIMVVLDVAFGYAGRFIQANAKGGATARNEYICRKMDSDVVVFGSSRCTHHYIPAIIEDSLCLSCYNAGTDGNGIILFFAKWKILSSRYNPKMIIYDVQESYDLLRDDNTKYLGDLRTYYEMPGVDSVMWSVDDMEKYKMHSWMYRYNSIWLQMLSDNIDPLSSDEMGFVGIDGTMAFDPGEHHYPDKVEYDPLKLYYLERLILDCQEKGVALVFCLSPMYKARKTDLFSPLYALCAKYQVPLFDYYSDSRFTQKRDYFFDSVHMNRKGAMKYTSEIASQIKSKKI